MSRGTTARSLANWHFDDCRTPRRSALAITCLVWLGLALPAAAQETGLKIGGTGTTLETMRVLGAAFELDNPDVRVNVLSSLGSTGGIKATLSGAIDIGVSARPLTAAERALGAKAIAYARSPLVFATAKANGATAITTTTLLEIYSGKRASWPNGALIRMIMRPAGDVNSIVLKDMSAQMKAAVTAAEKRPGMLFAVTDQEALEQLEKVPGALGASSLAEVMSRDSVLTALRLNGIDPSPESLADGTYPLQHTFYLVTGKTPSAAVSRFVDFVLSETGRKILSETGHGLPDANPARQP